MAGRIIKQYITSFKQFYRDDKQIIPSSIIIGAVSGCIIGTTYNIYPDKFKYNPNKSFQETFIDGFGCASIGAVCGFVICAGRQLIIPISTVIGITKLTIYGIENYKHSTKPNNENELTSIQEKDHHKHNDNISEY